MTDRILVRGELSAWVHVGRVFGGVLAVAGVILGVFRGSPGWIIAGSGTAVWLALEFVAWKARRLRTWLTLHPDGIEVEDRSGYRAIHDSQVSAVALETKKNLINGELSSITRKLRIWVDDQPQPVLMESKIKLGAVDPLAGLIDRLLERLGRRLQETIARGGTSSGDGWHLSRTALTIGRTPDDQQIPLSEIAAVEPFDGQMCVWRRGSDMAVARLPLSGRNVQLLPTLVQPYMSALTNAARHDSPLELGRVLFERRAHQSSVLATSIAGLAMIVIGAGMLSTFLVRQNGNEGVFIGGLILLGIGPVLALVGLWLGFSFFRCHERGVRKATPLGAKTLRYADVGSFQFSAVRHYHHGAYTGTQVTMRFRPLSGDCGPAIRFSTRVKGNDEDLEALRDNISCIIASRMAEQLRAGQSVRWTNNLEFTPTGIGYRPSGLLGRKEARFLPMSEYGGYDLKQGVFHLFARGNKKSIMTEQAAADNFYSGFFLLLMITREATTADLAASETR